MELEPFNILYLYACLRIGPRILHCTLYICISYLFFTLFLQEKCKFTFHVDILFTHRYLFLCNYFNTLYIFYARIFVLMIV